MMSNSLADKKLVLQAIKVLREVTNKYYGDSSKKKPLLEEVASPLFLQVTLKKIPKSKNIKMIRVNLPHSLVKNTSDVCLITGDLDKRNHKAEIEPDKLHYKELLNKNGISEISEVITLRQLRTEYKPFEAKLKLLAAYDVFLADNVILECLPKILGTHFFKKRKYPIRINMKTKNLKNEINKAISSKMFYITGRGNSCSAEIAYLDMKNKKIVDNVFSVVETLSKDLPGGWDNVLGVYLKTAKSKAVPIYISHGNPNDVKLPVSMEEDEFEIDELNTIPNALVKVYKDGRVETVKNSTVNISQVEGHEVEEIDLDPPSQSSDEEVVKPTQNESESKESDSDHVQKTTKKKIKTKMTLTCTDDIPVIDLEVSDELDAKNKKPRKGKRKSVCQLPSSVDIFSNGTPIQTKNTVEDLEVSDELDAKNKKPKKGKRKSVCQLPSSVDIFSNGTSIQTKNTVEDLECDELDAKHKKPKKGKRKSVCQLPSSVDNYSNGTPIQTKNTVEDKKKQNKRKMFAKK